MRLLTFQLAAVLLAGAPGEAAPPARQRPPIRKNIEYAHVGRRSLRLDAWVPAAGAGPIPAAVVVHGGAWLLPGRRFSVKPLLEALAEAGWGWFAVSYRTAPAGRAEGIENGIADVTAAVRFVEAHAAEYGVDRGRLALIGESSGGHLAAMALLRGGTPRVRALVAVASPMDLNALFWMTRALPHGFREFRQAELAALSPVTYVQQPGVITAALLPPMLLIHGTADILVPFSQSERMCERVRASGGECELCAVKGAGHGIRLWVGRAGYKQRMMGWLREQDGKVR